MIPLCGLEVQNPTHVLQSVKDSGNTFDLSPKWERTLLSFGIFYRICIAPPPQKKIKQSKYQSCYLTPCCGLEVQNPTEAHKSVKGPCNTFDLNPNWEQILPSFGNISWDMHRPPQKNSNNNVDI